jgi:hypothetical protein
MALVIVLGALLFAGWRLLLRRAEAPAKPTGTAASAPAPTGEVVTESEPNDTRAACQLLPRGAKLVVRGNVADGNEDWFCPASPGFASHQRIEVTAVPGCDLELEVHDGQGHALKRAIATGAGTPRVIDDTGPSPAARAIVVRPRPGCRDEKGAGYELRLAVLKSVEVDWEKEPNNVPDKGNPLRRGTAMVGFLSADVDVDCYVLPTQPAVPDARLRIDAVPLPSLALRLEVRGADGGLLYRAEGKPGEPLLLRGLGVRSWEGHVNIMIAAAAGAGPRRAYTLRGELETVGGPFEFEPNDEPRAATPLPLVPGEGLLVSGYLTSAGDVDCYGVSVIRPAPLVLSLEQLPAGLQPTATLLDARGATVVTCTAGQPCQGRPASPDRLELRLDRPERGSYTLKITADAGRYDNERPYRVRARYAAEPAKHGAPAGSK